MGTRQRPNRHAVGGDPLHRDRVDPGVCILAAGYANPATQTQALERRVTVVLEVSCQRSDNQKVLWQNLYLSRYETFRASDDSYQNQRNKEEAIKKIYAIKQRQADKPLPVIVADLETAEKLVIFDDKIRQLVAQHWPGPLTVVLPFKLFGQKKHFLETLGLRISSNIFCLALSKIFANPIVSTSANISGQKAIYNVEQIKEQFSRCNVKPDLLINAGNLPLTLPSTIIKSENGKIKILRQGKIICLVK